MRMFPADAGLILDISPSIFDEIGDPVGYTTLTPVAVCHVAVYDHETDVCQHFGC